MFVVAGDAGDKAHPHFYVDQAALTRLLAEAGFTLVRLDDVDQKPPAGAFHWAFTALTGKGGLTSVLGGIGAARRNPSCRWSSLAPFPVWRAGFSRSFAALCRVFGRARDSTHRLAESDCFQRR